MSQLSFSTKINKILDDIKNVLIDKLDPERIILFGSRAEGRDHKGSDIDLAIENYKKSSFREERKLRELIDEISGIYSVDLIFLDKVEADFAKMIRDKGLIIYEKKNVISTDKSGPN